MKWLQFRIDFVDNVNKTGQNAGLFSPYYRSPLILINGEHQKDQDQENGKGKRIAKKSFTHP